MLAREQSVEIVSPAASRRWMPLAIVVVATALGLGLAPAWLVSDESLKTLFAIALLVVPICFVLAIAKARAYSARETTFRMGLVIWWYLLISDALFDRISNVQGTYQGQYSIEAYGEGITWVAAFIMLAVVSIAAPGYLSELFAGPYKWASLFVLSCLVAVAYAPSPEYSAGWWFKLAVTLLTLRLCVSGMDSIDNIRAFLWASLVGLGCAVLLPLSRAFADPLTLFEGVGGRLNADPVVLSTTAGLVLILALTLNALRRHIWLIAIVMASVVVMFLAMGKTGILAGAIGAVAFFLLQKRVASGLVLLLFVGLVGIIIITTITPVGNYFMSYSGGATFTGRTDIWRMALPWIAERPIFGHGYLSSKFIWLHATGPYAEVGHLHNGFLEALYNNGLVGLVFLLGMHVVVLSNLLFAHRIIAVPTGAKTAVSVANILIIGAFALYLDLLIAGMFEPAFGSRPSALFMMFFAALGWSTALYTLAHRVKDRILVPSSASNSSRQPLPVSLRPGAMRSPGLR
jgi:O-antigen ligase